MADKFKLIACEVFKPALQRLLVKSDKQVDVEFIEKDAHNESDTLRERLSACIRTAEDSGEYKAVLLAYGLCGNSTLGLKANTLPLVMIRAHDCCTIFLGSRSLFTEHFSDNPSRPFSSPGYIATGSALIHESTLSEDMLGGGRSWEQLVEEYGEENAAYVKEVMASEVPGKDRIVYIRDPFENPPGLEEQVRVQAKEDGLEFFPLTGSDHLLEELVNGPWGEDVLVVPPGKSIGAVYDWDEVIRAE